MMRQAPTLLSSAEFVGQKWKRWEWFAGRAHREAVIFSGILYTRKIANALVALCRPVYVRDAFVVHP